MEKKHGVKAEMGMKVHENDNIELHGSARKNMDEKLNILLHKPYSFISQSTERNSSRRRRFAKDLLSFRNQDRKCPLYRKIKHQPYKMRKLACAGRLDAESAGLLIFTQNGKLAKSIISSREKEKEDREQGPFVFCAPLNAYERAQPWRLGVTAGQSTAGLSAALPFAFACEWGYARGISPPREPPPSPRGTPF